jgi:TolB protein
MKKFFFSLMIALAFSSPALAQESEGGGGLYIKIGQASLKKSLMAVPPFQFSGSPGSAKNGVAAGKTLFDVFRNDMEVSGFFEFIKPDAFLEDVSKIGLKPAPGEAGGFKYDAWKQIGTEFLVRVGYRINGNDVAVDAYVYHVPQQKLVLGKSYKGRTADARVVAHTFSNDVIKALTGEPASFLSKLVVSRSTSPGVKEIFVMDWDGANARQVTKHGTIAQSPAWSYDGRMIAYSAFAYHANQKTRNLDLFSYNLDTAKRFAVSYRIGVNSGASFFPDNKHMALTISNGGSPDIYKSTLDGRTLTRLTRTTKGELNVEPSVSPDGSKIAFSSDRSGNAMIYVMNSDGSNVKRLTIAGKYNSTPAWSPDGKRIAFAGADPRNFDIFIMDADGTNMQRLTSAKTARGTMASNEDPSFSPDGRNILFRSNRTGKFQLYVVGVDGENEHRITFDNHEYFKPRWSPSFD